MSTETKSAIERVRTARDADRPYTNDLLKEIFEGFVEIHGDRRFSDDSAIVGGLAKLGDFEVVAIGQQKGRDTNQRKFRNFGMPKPEGYRKALRLFKMAEKFGRPVITFIDTPGAYPGIDAEERGQAEAIALNLREMASLKVPIIVVVLGEGGSGGALAIGIGDRVLMMENSVYSVISPEGCAAILWKDAGESEKAADCLRLTAGHLFEMGLVDEIIKEEEPWSVSKKTSEDEKQDSEKAGSNQNGFVNICRNLKTTLIKHLKTLKDLDEEQLLEERFQKFRKMGDWVG